MSTIPAQSSVSSQTNRSSRPSYMQSARSSDVISHIPSGSRSRSNSSSVGPQLVNMRRANAGVVINGSINGYMLQIVFSTIHGEDWMTMSTANKCRLDRNRLYNDYYLEETYMDHRFKQRSRHAVTVYLGQDKNGRDVTITTKDIIAVVDNDNFHYQSQSLADPRNREFLVIGMRTIIEKKIEIRVDKLEIKIPNQYYQAPTEDKYIRLKALEYPDLSIRANLDFNIRNIEQKND
jgi:hypothetical protein